MQQQPTTEQRLIILEHRVTELERKAAAQEDRDHALLARVDGFIDDLRRIERVQMRSFDELKAGQLELKTELEARMDRLEVRMDRLEHNMEIMERNIEVLADTAKNHKVAIESVASDVSTILNIIRGGSPKLND
ncbi:MAG: hypothetical protein J2P36_35975 [Ktedonobacteraceae bacterium]|nr:hypothetical protein [Ktedonobacteraceae bacterium]